MGGFPEILTGMGADVMKRVLSEVSNHALERLLELTFEELRGRGVHYGLDGPYAHWDWRWGLDAVGILEKRTGEAKFTIQPTPNPRRVLPGGLV